MVQLPPVLSGTPGTGASDTEIPTTASSSSARSRREVSRHVRSMTRQRGRHHQPPRDLMEAIRRRRVRSTDSATSSASSVHRLPPIIRVGNEAEDLTVNWRSDS